MDNLEISIDIETMSTEPNAPIVSIGAVAFDKARVYNEYYAVVDLRKTYGREMSVDPDTFLFWIEHCVNKTLNVFRTQYSEVQANTECKHLSNILLDISKWINSFNLHKDQICIWGKGSDFDNVILQQAYKEVGINIPWSYWKNRCVRTAVDVEARKGYNAYENVEFVGEKHHALDDAFYQAKLVQYCLNLK